MFVDSRSRNLVALAVALAVAPSLGAQTKLVPSAGAPYDIAAYAVGVSHNIAVLGTPLDDGIGTFVGASGSAAIFRFNGTDWVQEATIVAPAPTANDRFGLAVAIDGDLIAVAAPYDDDAANDGGAVHLFRFHPGGWDHEATLLAPDAGAFDQFGWSVAVSGDRVVVGARQDDDRGLDAGAAYVFHRGDAGWTLEAKLTAGDGGPYDHFGTSVSIDGDLLLAGAPTDDPFGWGSGAAYPFRLVNGAWTAEPKLTPLGVSWSAEFGQSVDLDGGTAVIGAWGDDEQGWDAGAAYVFHHAGSSWSLDAKLMPAAGAGGDLFGAAVSVQGNNVIVGAPLASAGGPGSGTATRFHRQGLAWNEAETMVATSDAIDSGFGGAVAVDDTAYLVGAPYDQPFGSESGCAYVFTFIDPLFADLNADGSVDQFDLAILLGAWGDLGGPADLDQDGIVAAPDLALMLGAWTLG